MSISHQLLITAARKGRKVNVINLGLEPSDALQIGLDVEKVDRKGKVAVADYVPIVWSEWLQTNRVELNAMTTPQFIEWLDHKMEESGNGKLIPPNRVMMNKLKEFATEKIEGRVRDRILREAGFDNQVLEATSRINPLLEKESGLLRGIVIDNLKKVPENQWSKPVENFAIEVLNNFES